ncbi:MAG: radical SAM protein [Synergistota bacterium]|nr:radical SAM protein [Synergistota bacterium]
MRILLISPGKDVYYAKRLGRAFKLPPLGLSTIAALVKPGIEVSILDEHVEPLNYDDTADLVGISVMTAVAPRAYEIAERFMARGAKVVLGGPHPSALPEEAIQHCDAVVIGEAEGSWQRLIDDFERGHLEKFYFNENRPDLANLPEPRRDLYKKKAYFVESTIQTSRGCPYGCSFCSVSNVFGKAYRHRPVEDVVRSIEHMGKRLVGFMDDNVAGNRRYSKELFKALAPLKIKWAGQASVNMTEDQELLELAEKSGCVGLFMGFETVSKESMGEIGKSHNKIEEFKANVRRLHDHGIVVLGAFIFGFDSDDRDVFKRTVDFVYGAKIDLAQFSILTPLPGTKFYEKLSSENRIIDTDWSKYDMGHVVFKPAQMSPEELDEGATWAWKEFYSRGSIARRVFGMKFDLFKIALYFLPVLTINLSFKKAIDFGQKLSQNSNS